MVVILALATLLAERFRGGTESCERYRDVLRLFAAQGKATDVAVGMPNGCLIRRVGGVGENGVVVYRC